MNSTPMQNTIEKKTISIDETTKRKIQAYARFKRIEKRLQDKLEKARSSILADLGNVACVAVYEEQKLASVLEVSRNLIDSKALEQNFPQVYKAVSKISISLQLRTH